MAIKNIIAKGIGFSFSGPQWIVTHGFNTTAMWTEETAYSGSDFTEETAVTNANRWAEERDNNYGMGWVEE